MNNFVIVLGMAFLCAGCETPRPLPPIALPPSAETNAMEESPSHQLTPIEEAPPQFSDHHTAASARAETESLPEIADLRIQQEILLHAALYRAAFESNVGNTGRFVIEPVHETYPPNLNVDPAEFRMRVLAELADLGVPVAWTPSTWREQRIDYFPGTDEPATRLIIRIFQRDEHQATVVGEVADRTAGERSSQQGVIAIWDGAAWNIERDRVRVVW